MIKLISSNPLQYEDEHGNEVSVQEIVCPEHGNKVKYIEHNGEIIMVRGKEVELLCDAWRKAVKGESS